MEGQIRNGSDGDVVVRKMRGTNSQGAVERVIKNLGAENIFNA
jgi:hypothetical protein